MVNIQGAEIIKAAFQAFATKLLNKGEFPFPVSGAFMDAMPVLVPIVAQASIRAKAIGAFLAACFALAGLTPAMREVTSLSAKLGPFMLPSWFPTMFASSHGYIIPKYFDIACERIENAQRQIRLFA